MPNIDAVQQGQSLDESLELHPPRYPADALKEGKTGVTVLVVDIDAQGGVTGTRVERSSGDARLDAVAQEAATKWRFTPAMKQGQPVASKVRVPIEFALDAERVDSTAPVRAALALHARGPAPNDWFDALMHSSGASWTPRTQAQEEGC
jgi:TonB family protein